MSFSSDLFWSDFQNLFCFVLQGRCGSKNRAGKTVDKGAHSLLDNAFTNLASKAESQERKNKIACMYKINETMKCF